MNDIALPNFFLLGAMKCGTTSLYRYMEQHPDVYFPANKEPQYFSNDDLYARGICYYQDRFFKKAGKFKARGDATPHYLYYAKAAYRIEQSIKSDELRFLVILRDPVARAYSHYWNIVREGIEPLSFADALENERLRIIDTKFETLGTLPYHYVAAGKYAAQLRRYFEVFSPDKFLILLHEDLKNEPRMVMRSVFEFLDLEPLEVDTTKQHNPAGASRSVMLQRWIRKPGYVKGTLGRLLPDTIRQRLVNELLRLNKKQQPYPDMDQDIARALREEFIDDIHDLESLIGRDLSKWKC